MARGGPVEHGVALDAAEGAANEIPQANHPQIRFLRATRVTSRFPLADVATEGWKACTPETAPKVSAVAYFFARHVREHHPVPVGLVDVSWGGAPLAAFTPLTTIASDAALQPAVLHWSRMADRHATTLLEIEKEKREIAAAAARGQEPPAPVWRPGLEAWSPAGIYNAMIAPLTPHAIRGVIWYQGESDASPERAPVYARLFEATIREWRRAWGVGDFPFLFVQLANWTAGPGNAWPELREAQRQTLSVANTGMAVTIDVGSPTDIHPRDKKTVGTRLALAARALAYGERIEHSGPLFRQAVPDGSALRVFFDHAEGLAARGGAPVEGFEIAGPDGRYVSAEARVEGATVVVSSAAVPAPRSVRYGWADNPTGQPRQRGRPPGVPVPREPLVDLAVAPWARGRGPFARGGGGGGVERPGMPAQKADGSQAAANLRNTQCSVGVLQPIRDTTIHCSLNELSDLTATSPSASTWAHKPASPRAATTATMKASMLRTLGPGFMSFESRRSGRSAITRSTAALTSAPSLGRSLVQV